VTLDIALLLGLVTLSAFLFWKNWWSPDVVALVLVLLLVFTRLLPAKSAFLGFGSETVIMILGLLILTAALEHNGVVDIMGRFILRFTGDRPLGLLAVVMVASAGLSAFMSNTASTAFFLPVVIGITKKSGVNPGQLLLPLAFSGILSSSVTLVSTSTNLVVSGLLTQYGEPAISMFEMAPVGVPITIAGLAYMMLAGALWLGRRRTETAPQPVRNRPYLSEVVVLPDSRLVGHTLAESRLDKMELHVVRVFRSDDQALTPLGNTVVHAGDVLVVEATPEDLLKVKDKAGIEIRADAKYSNPDLPLAALGIAEVIVLARSALLDRTLKSLRFAQRYDLQVLGINRHGEILNRKISEMPLQIGDILLVQGDKDAILALEEEIGFRVIGTFDERKPNRKRALIAITIFVGVLTLATFDVLPLGVAVISGAVVAFLAKCITPEQAYKQLDWRVVILIGSMLAVGTAMETTGTARFLAAQVVRLAGDSPLLLLGGFFTLTVMLTQIMSNQAAAVVILPIALQTAMQLGLNPRTFAMMVAVAASCSYLTPLEPSCLMVYGPGGYRTSDFLKIGAPLTVLIALLALWYVPRVWPL